jgi:type II secretory pathway component PulC
MSGFPQTRVHVKNAGDREMRKKILLTLTVLALASVTVLAANREGVVVSKDGRTTIATKRTPSVTRTEPNDPSLVTIYDNIATAYPKGSYWAVKVTQSWAQPIC